MADSPKPPASPAPPKGGAAKGGKGLTKKVGPFPLYVWVIAGLIGVYVAYRVYENRAASSATNATAGSLTSPDDSSTLPQDQSGSADDSGSGGGGTAGGEDLDSLLQYFETQDQGSQQTIGQIVAGEQGLEASQEALIGELNTNTTALSQTLAQQLGTVAASAVGGLSAASTGALSLAAPQAAPAPAKTAAPDNEPNPGTQSAGAQILAEEGPAVTNPSTGQLAAQKQAQDVLAGATTLGVTTVYSQPPLSAQGAKKTGTNPKVTGTLH